MNATASKWIRIAVWAVALAWFGYLFYDFLWWLKRADSAMQQAALAAMEAFYAVIGYAAARAVDSITRAATRAPEG